MMAVFVSTASSSLSLYLTLALAVVGLVLAPQPYRISLRHRRTVALLAVVVVLFVIGYGVRADEFVMVDECKGLGPSDWQYWLLSCWSPLP